MILHLRKFIFEHETKLTTQISRYQKGPVSATEGVYSIIVGASRATVVGLPLGPSRGPSSPNRRGPFWTQLTTFPL